MPRVAPASKRPTRRASAPARGRVARPSNRNSPAGGGLLAFYFTRSQTPLTALMFVLPILVLHELGVQWYGTLSGSNVEHRVTAFTLLMRFFHTCGATGRYLPAMAVVAILLSWHVARRDRWDFNIFPLPVMAIESLLLALPLVGVYFLFSSTPPTYLATGEWKLMASLYLGAGVYEELIFRLAAFSVLSLFLIDIGRVRPLLAVPVIVLTSAILFSAYHMLGSTSFPLPAFVFVALRGVYYGVIFLERGFGVTVGVHTAYDLLFLGLKQVNDR